jgi:hypothetical protein
MGAWRGRKLGHEGQGRGRGEEGVGQVGREDEEILEVVKEECGRRGNELRGSSENGDGRAEYSGCTDAHTSRDMWTLGMTVVLMNVTRLVLLYVHK